jgi:hypothetical protein
MVPRSRAHPPWVREVKPPTARHRVHAKLDELIAASNTHRPVNPANVKKRVQLYANLDDDFDTAWRISHEANQPNPHRAPRNVR